MKLEKLPKIALGAWAWGNDGTFGSDLNIEELRPIFNTALENGLNLWDTAFVYGMGVSEEILGKFIKESDEKCIVSTKFTPQCGDPNAENPVTAMFENSQKLLNSDFIDIYWIHNPVGAPEYTKKLVETAENGNIGRIGVSNHNLDEIKEAHQILKDAGLELSAVQNHFSLLNRSSEDSGILDYCKQNNITFFSYMVLEQGALSGKYDTKNPFPEGSARSLAYNPILSEIEKINEAVGEIAANHNVSIAQIMISWAIAKETLPIIGATKVKHVTDAIEAGNIVLSKDEIKIMEDVADKANVSTIREWEKVME